MIKYIGSKRTLLPTLLRILEAFPELRSVADLFSGTSRVGHASKQIGRRVVANDHNAYAHVLAQCYVEADLEDVGPGAAALIAELNRLPGVSGYFTHTFCEQSRFFQPRNGEKVDAIRDRIEALALPPLLRAVLLTSLMEAADRVDSTCGLQMAFVKQWAPRSYNSLELRMPAVLPRASAGASLAMSLDANAAARTIDTDIVYVDPPYNQHSYLSNYHIWESLVRWDQPDVYGVACKRIDCQERKSNYNSKRLHHQAFADLIANIAAPLVVVSFSDEGFQSQTEIEACLAAHGDVFVVSTAFKRYVGAQIGIYNPAGAKVGRVSHLHNHENIYLLARPELASMVPDYRNRCLELAAATANVHRRGNEVATRTSSTRPKPRRRSGPERPGAVKPR